MKKIKKGEISTAMIVTFIILIASFIIILYFYFMLNPAKAANNEVCHNSVFTRSAGVFPKETIPLNCKTSYVCISKDGSCESMTNPEVEKVNTIYDVYHSLAEQMANCWWMFGEGRANYIGDKFTSELYCSICSQVSFDDSLEKVIPKVVTESSPEAAGAGATKIYTSTWEINKTDFYNYLSNTNVSGKGITYLNYMLGLQNAQQIRDVLKANNYDFGTINLEKQQFIVMGEFSRVSTFNNVLLGIGKGILLFAVLPIPVVGGPLAMGIVASTLMTDSGYKGYMIGMVMTGESGQGYLSPTIIEANSEDYSKLQCADVKTLP
jgi:hypothetical protein